MNIPHQSATNEIIKDLHKQGVQVLSSRIEVAKLHVLLLTCRVLKAQSFNLLEEFVLKGLFGITPQPKIHEMSTLLGLDQIFIEYGIRNLVKGGLIERDPLGEFVLTLAGKEAYESQRYYEEDSEEIYITYSPHTSQIWPGEKPQNAIIPQHYDVDFDEKDVNRVIDGLYDFAEISSIERVDVVGEKEYEYLAVLIYDEAKLYQKQTEKLTLLTYRLDDRQQDSNLRKHFIKIHPISEWGSTFSINEGEVVTGENANQTRTQWDTAVPQPAIPDKTPSKYFTGREIRKVFLDTLKATQKFAIIFSPWINNAAVDQELIDVFEEIAKRNAFVFIGWGIAESKETQGKQPAPRLVQQLQAIRTSKGFPAVNLFFVGNSHSKDVIIDKRIALGGSYNYLSFNPDFQANDAIFEVRKETLFKFDERDAATINAMYDSWRHKFYPAIQKKWLDAARAYNPGDMIRCIVAWNFMDAPNIALERIATADPEITINYPSHLLKIQFKVWVDSFVDWDLGTAKMKDDLKTYFDTLKFQPKWLETKSEKKLRQYLAKS
ncbi:MAG: hypothetical protein D6732_09135 [Methanobacteriota archaeon]|nr:MAG: hypothetical protein D6732_09135 [Euryarchaeota archaeon]